MTVEDFFVEFLNRPSQPFADPGVKPWNERLCLYVSVIFAVWTLCCNAVVFAGGSLHDLLLLSGFLASVSALGLWLRARRSSPNGNSQTVADDLDESLKTIEPEAWEMPWAGRGVLVAAGLGAAVFFSRPESFVTLWFGIAAVLVIATGWLFWRSPSSPSDSTGGSVPQAEPEERSEETARLERAKNLGLVALALACVALGLFSHASNADDSFYISLAVAEVDAPSSPLLDGDPMHGVEGLPLYIPIYRAHSFEILCAAVAYLTGLPTIGIFHILATCLGSFFLPLAYAALLRRLLPRDWLFATFILMIVLIVPGDAVRWYGNLTFVRMWQGKSLFLSLMTPLLYLFALRFAARPSLGAWWHLAAAQVAAIGFTSSAFWAAPVAVALGLAVGLPKTWTSLRTLAFGLSSSGYLIFLGLMLKGSVVSSVKAPPPLSPAERISEVFTLILGAESHALWMVTFAATAIAWALVPPGLARRFALIVPVGAWMIFINPYLGGWVMAHVTHRQHWRSMWALPVPLLITFLILAPLYLSLGRGRLRGSTATRRLASCFLLGLYALCVPKIYGFSPANGVALKTPSLKVSTEDYARAEAIHHAYAPGTLVAAPPEVNIWLPTFEQRVRPLSVRFYLRRMGPILGEEELKRRDFIPRLLVGDTEWAGAPKALERELSAFPEIAGVALPESRQSQAYREVLERLGYARLPSAEAEALDLDLWFREPAP